MLAPIAGGVFTGNQLCHPGIATTELPFRLLLNKARKVLRQAQGYNWWRWHVDRDARRITPCRPARERTQRLVPPKTPHTRTLPSASLPLGLQRRNPTHPLSVFRFRVNDPCFIRGKPQDQLFTVVSCFTHDSGFPHYIVRDALGNRFTISQLRMSSKAIKERK